MAFGSEAERRRNTRDSVGALGEECPKRQFGPAWRQRSAGLELERGPLQHQR
jgi:hypothetical protein